MSDPDRPPADSARHRSPGVLVPPPLIYIAAFVTALGLNRVWPMGLLPAGASAGTAAWMERAAEGLLILGVIPLLFGVFGFVRHRTAISPAARATTLITGGPYRFSRNPIYLAFTLLYLGAALRSNVLWTLTLLLVVLVVMSRFVIAREEQHLTAVFGEPYRAYCRDVRRWI